MPEAPACKRLRTRYQVRQEHAALRLQRWYRTALQTRVWDMDSARNVSCLWRGDLIKIIEPNGIGYCFVARALALYARRTA